MKNILIASMVLIFSVLVLTNCKKRYKCECTNRNPVDSVEYTIENEYLRKFSKSKADEEREKCEATDGCTFLRDKN